MVELSKDPIANYVVNKAIEVSDADQKKKFSELISSCRADLVSRSVDKDVPPGLTLYFGSLFLFPLHQTHRQSPLTQSMSSKRLIRSTSSID